MRQSKKRKRTGYRVGLLSVFLILNALITAEAYEIGAVTDGNNAVSTPVRGSYTPGAGTDQVVMVDISWGDLDFTYQETGAGTWNSGTHRYEYNFDSPGWIVSHPDGNHIRVINRSNRGIDAAISFTPSSEHTDLQSKFTLNDQSTSQEQLTMYLDTADNRQGENGAGKEVIGDWYMHIMGGKLEKSEELGTVTIQIQ